MGKPAIVLIAAFSATLGACERSSGFDAEINPDIKKLGQGFYRCAAPEFHEEMVVHNPGVSRFSSNSVDMVSFSEGGEMTEWMFKRMTCDKITVKAHTRGYNYNRQY